MSEKSFYRVLAVEPFYRGFGYVVLEGKDKLVDWGLKEVRQRDVQKFCLEEVERLINLYHPDIVAMQDLSKNPRRSQKAKEINCKIGELTLKRGAKLRVVGKKTIHQCFISGNEPIINEVDAQMAEAFRELKPCLPRMRRTWESPDPRKTIFAAMAMALNINVI